MHILPTPALARPLTLFFFFNDTATTEIYTLSLHDALPILLDVARNDPDSEVRLQAVFWLSQVGSDRAVTALDSILSSATGPELQDKAIFSLSQIHNARAAQILRDYAANERGPGGTTGKAGFWLG